MDELIVVLEETNRLLSQHFSNNTLEIISIAISGAALLFAILVPVRIANKQNAIALLEKRFAAYSDLLKVKSFADMMKKDDCSFQMKDIIATGKDPEFEKARRCSEVLLNFQAMFHSGEVKPDAANVARVTIFTVRSLELSLHTLPMLYSKKLPKKGADASKDVSKIFESLAQFMSAMVEPNRSINDTDRTDFVSRVDAFFEKYADIFEDGIRL